MGYSMLTRLGGALLRYTEWVHFPGPSTRWQPNWDELYAVELYNHNDDPAENANVYAGVEGSEVAKALRERLRAGWPANVQFKSQLAAHTVMHELHEAPSAPQARGYSYRVV